MRRSPLVFEVFLVLSFLNSIPAEAGIPFFLAWDTRFRGYDSLATIISPYEHVLIPSIKTSGLLP